MLIERHHMGYVASRREPRGRQHLSGPAGVIAVDEEHIAPLERGGHVCIDREGHRLLIVNNGFKSRDGAACFFAVGARVHHCHSGTVGIGAMAGSRGCCQNNDSD